MIIWKDIPSHPGYEASNEGQIRNKKTGRIRKFVKNPRGYYYVTLFSGENPQRVCRLIAEAFFGPCSLFVDHIDGDRTNDNIKNLRYVTREVNNLNKVGRTAGKRWDPTLEMVV